VHLIFTILFLAFAGDAVPILDLQRLLNGVDDRRPAYDFRIDCTAAPRSALSETDAVWADVFLRQRRSIARSRDV